MSRPTSALFSVLNFKVTPDSGSYAFTSRVALGTLGASASAFSSGSAGARFLFLLAYFSESRFGMLYFVVMRACVAQDMLLVMCRQQAVDRGLTHRGRARLEEQRGLPLPVFHSLQVHHLGGALTFIVCVRRSVVVQWYSLPSFAWWGSHVVNEARTGLPLGVSGEIKLEHEIMEVLLNKTFGKLQ